MSGNHPPGAWPNHAKSCKSTSRIGRTVRLVGGAKNKMTKLTNSPYFLDGKKAYTCYKHKLALYFGVPAKQAHADTIRRLFMPPESQSMMQIAQPRDKAILKWLAEWEKAKEEDNE